MSLAKLVRKRKATSGVAAVWHLELGAFEISSNRIA